jgi:hypothetical protein
MRIAIPLSKLLVVVLTAAVSAFGAVEPQQRGQVSRWIDEPEQHLPGWTFRVDGPVMTFQMRMAVTVKAEANVRKAKLVGHDLHFFVKVADANGHWFPQRRYSSIEKLPNSGDLSVTERFFAKPGDYQVAFVIYDAVSGEHGVWKHPVHVQQEESLVSHPSAGAVEFIDPDEPFKPGSSPNLPPLENHKPLQVDVILNLTERSDLEIGERTDLLTQQMLHGGHFGARRVYPDWQLGRERQDFTTETLLTIADTLNELKVNGCTRVSVVDAVRSKVLLDRRGSVDPTTLWAAMRERRATHKVDAHVLALRQQAGTFLHNFMQTMIEDNSGCNTTERPAERAIVLLSDALVFPESKQLTPVTPPTVVPPVTRFYFFRMTMHEYIQQIGLGRAYTALAMSPDDQVGKLLRDLDARRFDLSEPKDFQKALPKLMEALSQ